MISTYESRIESGKNEKTMKNFKQHKLSLEPSHHEYRPSTLQVNEHARPKIARLFKLPIYITTLWGITQDSKLVTIAAVQLNL
jgi:hypothetical protein